MQAVEDGVHRGAFFGNVAGFFPLLGGKHVAQRLFNRIHPFKSACEFFVPLLVVPGEVVGINHFALGAFVASLKGLQNIERTVIVGEFFAFTDVAHGQLKVVGGGDAVGREAVVHETRVVPAEDIFAVPVAVGIFKECFAAAVGQFSHLRGGEKAVERIHCPGDGAFGDVTGGDNAAANIFADPANFGIGV